MKEKFVKGYRGGFNSLCMYVYGSKNYYAYFGGYMFESRGVECVYWGRI
jgi:hypothetical protein